MSAKRDWMLLLSDFSRRHAGYHTRLELNDLQFGAQVVEENYPLRGVVYDPRDNRVEIMLGDGGSTDRRFTHTISDVSGLELLRSNSGDDTLCIEHEGSRTLLLIRHAPGNSGATREVSANP